MDSTRLSVARLLETNVPLTWQEAVAIVQEVAMVSDVNAAMNSSPSLVTPETCFLTTAGEIDLTETTDAGTPHAVADLLRLVLRGRDAPAALLALAQRRPDDLYGELAAFSSGPRRPVVAAIAARVLSRAPAPGSRRSTPAALPPLAQPGQRRWAPMAAPPGAAPPLSVVNVPAQPTVVSAPAPPLAAAPLSTVVPLPTAPPVVAVPRQAVVPKATPPVARAPQPADPDAELRRPDPSAFESSSRNPPASTPPDGEPPAGALSALAPDPAPTPPLSAPAPVAPLALASRPGPTALSPRVPLVELVPQVADTGELQRLRLKSASANRRRGARSVLSRHAAWIAGGTVAAAAAAALLWSAGSTQDPGDTPALLEAKAPSILPVWPFAPAVAAVTPAASTTGPPQFGTTPSLPPALGNTSTTSENVLGQSTSAPPLELTAGTTGFEAPPRDNIASGVVAAAPPVPYVAPRIDRAPTAPAASPPAAPPLRARNAPSTVGNARSGSAAARETFSADDSDVAPPDLRRQQLPTAVLEPGTPVPEGWPYLTLVVDETGVVESVRLTAEAPPPGQSIYRHRMLVAAAKAWQFAPARRNGQPVRYSIRVPLEP